MPWKSAALLLALSLAACSHTEARAQKRIAEAPAPPLSPELQARYEKTLARERERGAVEASADIARGAAKLILIGRLDRCVRKVALIMKERYGIEVETPGCMTTDFRDAYVGAYNDAVKAHLNQRHGMDVFEKVMDEAGCP